MPINISDTPDNPFDNNSDPLTDTKVGRRAKAKFSEKNRTELSPAQLNLARHIVRSLSYTDNGGIHATGEVIYKGRSYDLRTYSRRFDISDITLTTNGIIIYTTRRSTVVSLGDFICQALKSGVPIFDSITTPQTTDVDVDIDVDVVHEPESEPEPDPVVETRAMLFDRFIELRRYCESENGAQDIMSTRSLLNGAKQFDRGLPIDGVVSNLTLTWPAEAKRQMNIADWDQASYVFDPSNVQDNTPDVSDKIRHKALDYVRMNAEARIPILLVGPAGCGKTYMAEQLASEMDLKFRSISVTSGMSISWLAGRVNINDKFIETGLIECFTTGGVFLLDEIDAGESNTLLFINQAIANGVIEIPSTGKRYERHADFICIGAANTYGTGRNREYGGRNALDGATLDRFKAGRVPMTYDEDMERMLVVGNE